MTIVSIVGKKRSGKDTMADFMVTKLNARKYALATPIKLVLARAYEELHLVDQTGVGLTFADFNGETDYDRETPLMLSNANVVDLMTKSIEILQDEYGLKTVEPNEFLDKLNAINAIRKNSLSWSVRRLMQTLGTDIVVNTHDKHFWLKLMMIEYINAFASGSKLFIVSDIRQKHEIDFMRHIKAMTVFVERDIINTTTTDQHITEAGLGRRLGDAVIENNGTIEEFYEKISNLFHTEVLQNVRR
ncbi:dNMP kinase [Acinetobacter phage AbTZA1]|uniref:DNMP kinase n=1 Tax=Acinetobacter phage AbTZA1 TaxID=2500827 RepID=A0A3T0IGS0_9CAUD|nr:dNMP kinase [Acinetobacter phage AbTZA1]AZU98588.1 dNMP kinase [Acinetobacter phage AbTZA1]